MEKITCLLLVLPDGRRFFTKKTNLKHLLEFSNAWNAKWEIVDIEDKSVILSLKDLATAICNQASNYSTTLYEKKEQKTTEKTVVFNEFTKFNKLSLRQTLTKQSTVAKNYVSNRMARGKKVDIKKLSKKFAQFGIKSSTISRYVSQAKKSLEETGQKIVKLKPGVYQLEEPR
jgi:hypothetical protein